MSYKERILELRGEGKTYNEITKELGCNKATVSYHCANTGQKERKVLQSRINKRKHPYITKYYRFISPSKHIQTKKYKSTKWQQKAGFKWQDIVKLHGNTPLCYICKSKIDIHKTNSYVFEHKVPRSQGGKNTLENLEIACKDCNDCKNKFTVDECLNHCVKILENNGYTVTKNKLP